MFFTAEARIPSQTGQSGVWSGWSDTRNTFFSEYFGLSLSVFLRQWSVLIKSSETSSAVYQTTPNLLGSETYSVMGLLLVVSFSVGSRRCFVCTMARMVHLWSLPAVHPESSRWVGLRLVIWSLLSSTPFKKNTSSPRQSGSPAK